MNQVDIKFHDHKIIPTPKQVKVVFANQVIAESKRSVLVRKRIPQYYFPIQDVNLEFLKPVGESSESLNEASRWSLQVGDQSAKNAAWRYQPESEEDEDWSNYVTFKWDKVDAWYEEDELIKIHPRDPYVRIDVIRSSRHIKVELGGVSVAESQRPLLLFETGLPIRYYLPRKDVRMDMLIPSDKTTRCPYKGEASYYSLVVGDQELEDLIWYYPYPNLPVAKMQNMLSFYDEKLEGFLVDGEKPNWIATPRV